MPLFIFYLLKKSLPQPDILNNFGIIIAYNIIAYHTACRRFVIRWLSNNYTD